MLYDISPTLSENFPVWPGDTALSREVLLDINSGSNITLSTLRTTAHLGAHADAPSHYSSSGATIDERDVKYYLGPCQVFTPKLEKGSRALPLHLAKSIKAERFLLKTLSFTPTAPFDTHFSSYSPELVDLLHSRGVITIGIDTPSIDLYDDKELLSHQRCLLHNMAILEGLALAHVPDGSYELIALPLKLKNFDASPVRAILRRL